MHVRSEQVAQSILEPVQRHDQLPAARAHDRTVGGASLLVQLQEVAYLLLLVDQELLIHPEQAVATLGANLQLEHVFVGQGVSGPKVGGKRLRKVKGRVRGQDFVGGPVLRVEIDRERFARQVLLVRRQLDSPEAVPRVFVGLENDRAVEQRQKAGDLVQGRILRIRMQLDRAAPCFFPFLVQVNEQVDPAMQHESLVDVEVDVDIEALPAEVVVRAAAKERLVGDQVGDAGELAHRGQERLGIDVLVERPVERADFRNVLDDRFASHQAKLVGRALFVEYRKVAKKRIAVVRIEKMVDGDMAKRLGLSKFRLNFGCAGEYGWVDHACSRRRKNSVGLNQRPSGVADRIVD